MTDKLVLLGTAGGPSVDIDAHGNASFGPASALLINGRIYLVDCGEGVYRQLRFAGLGAGGKRSGLENLDSIFITHLHSDHIAGYFELLLYGGSSGLGRLARPVGVFGPGPRGDITPFAGSGEPQALAGGPDPYPGIEAMHNLLINAYAVDINDRTRNSRKVDIRDIVNVHNIEVPYPPHFVSANETPCPRMRPFTVMENQDVKVSATLVAHAPMFPAFAFRFDTRDSSVVFSGDTAPCDNLVELANGCDILVHEALDATWLAEFDRGDNDEERRAVAEHLLNSHTTADQVGRIATRAGARMLVINHLVPSTGPKERWVHAADGLAGRALVIGEDLLTIDLPVAGSA